MYTFKKGSISLLSDFDRHVSHISIYYDPQVSVLNFLNFK